MRVGDLGHEQAAPAQVGDDARVGVLDEDARPGRHLGGEPALAVDGVQHGEVVLEADAHVVLAEGRRGVHDASALGRRHVVAGDHHEGRLVGRDEGVGRLVAQSDKAAAGERAEDAGALAQDGLDEVGGEHEALAAALGERVLDVRVHGGGNVRDQRPGGRGPDEQRRGNALSPAVAAFCLACEQRGALRVQREAHVDARLFDLLVALRHLVTRDGRAAAGAVGHDLVALVEEVLVPDLAQQPPHRLDVLVGERVVGVAEVDPETDALGQAVPLLEVGEDALLAETVELDDAVLLDLLLAVDAQPALDLELDGQTVRVPARLARDLEATHRLVAREDVLEDAREHVVRARAPVGRRRAFVEDEERRVLAQGEALLEDAALPPEGEDARVEFGELDARGDVAEARSPVVAHQGLGLSSRSPTDAARRGRGAGPTGSPAAAAGASARRVGVGPACSRACAGDRSRRTSRVGRSILADGIEWV